MKKILFIGFLVLLAQGLSAQSLRTLKSYKDDKTTIVRDSAGTLLDPSDWYAKVKANTHTIDLRTKEGQEPKEFTLRKMTEAERRLAILQSDRVYPMTLAGFTTGKPLPAFEEEDLNGNKFSNESLKGKVIVIDFWFKDAAPCKAQVPDLNRLVKKYKGKNVVFLAPTYDPAFDVKEFLKVSPFSYTVFADVENMIIDMKVGKYPTHVVVDQMGIVQFVTIGQTDNIFDQLDYEIKNLLY
jgi:peroxiredoxin